MTFKTTNEGHSRKIYTGKYSVLPAFLKLYVDSEGREYKFYDECGFNLNDRNPSYGHSEKGARAVGIVEGGRAANYILMLLCSIEGIDFAELLLNLLTLLCICSSGLKQTNF